ncbi:uncharacterized protein VP01_3384g2 [Puccinia sorghi]|uniref:Reverse transcriptase RNase H-like domain-containing protein n=1 Tax=Puccinia sorghi TaxID=27349 RepID=A0A0L6UWP4_9BASI|nr:uncharacterized protein VP01_3384g2 [Puccinia sorghi]
MSHRLFQQNKDGTLKLCDEYRKLNNLTRKNAYPVPPMRVVDSKEDIFGSFKFISQYWLNLLHPVAFKSRKLQSCELDYKIKKRKLLAIFYFLQYYSNSLLLTEVVLLSSYIL